MKYWYTDHQFPVSSPSVTGVHTPRTLFETGVSPLWLWHMDKLTDVPNRKFTTWERHWGPSVAVRGSSPSALLILHQKRLRHTPLPHLRSASPPFTHNSTPTPFSLYDTLSQRDSPGKAQINSDAGAKRDKDLFCQHTHLFKNIRMCLNNSSTTRQS